MGVRHALSPESSLTGAAMVRESDYAVWNELTDRAEEAGIGIQRGKTAGRRINRERDKPTDRHVYRQANRQTDRLISVNLSSKSYAKYSFILAVVECDLKYLFARSSTRKAIESVKIKIRWTFCRDSDAYETSGQEPPNRESENQLCVYL